MKSSMRKDMQDACPHSKIKKNGFSEKKNQRYCCTLCGKTFSKKIEGRFISWKDIKHAVYLKKYAGKNYREIAKQLNFSPSTIHKHVSFWASPAGVRRYLGYID